jgi:hypothetical protein
VLVVGKPSLVWPATRWCVPEKLRWRLGPWGAEEWADGEPPIGIHLPLLVCTRAPPPLSDACVWSTPGVLEAGGSSTAPCAVAGRSMTREREGEDLMLLMLCIKLGSEEGMGAG